MPEIWEFYGRDKELNDIARILESRRWFFCQITGRRRIGKTTLIRTALERMNRRRDALYVAVPDSDEHGAIETFRNAFEDFFDRESRFGDIRTWSDVAEAIETLCNAGTIIVIDEFQYFHRKALAPFLSFLQAKLDRLRDTSFGGLFVLGSIHTEMTALIEDRDSPLFSRLTHRLPLDHWDFATLFEMFDAHDICDAHQRLYLWTLFEGVPKFYRDCFEAGVLRPGENHRETILRELFFEGTSPLKDEATNWFLRELRGRYDTLLKLLARLGPCGHGELARAFEDAGSGESKQLGGYLAVLIDRYRMVERLLPVFARQGARRSRYVIADNFLSAWLAALARNVERARIQPAREAIGQADVSLMTHEGFAWEKMVRVLMEECSRKAVGDFPLNEIVRGYWNKPDGAEIEIDLVAYDEGRHSVRFGSCKRAAVKHDAQSLSEFHGHVGRFLQSKDGRRFGGWTIEHALFSPVFEPSLRRKLESDGYVCRDLQDYSLYLSRDHRP